MTGLLGLGSTSAAYAISRYRWIFILVSICALGVGFYFNVLHRATRTSRVVFWLATAFTLATILHWGWWFDIR
jgi:hypothetical protein